jgi:hypothetical protein
MRFDDVALGVIYALEWAVIGGVIGFFLSALFGGSVSVWVALGAGIGVAWAVRIWLDATRIP